jgi:hypothetical protein
MMMMMLYPPRRWLHLIVVRGFEYARDPESYVESNWKNYHVITFPGSSVSRKRDTMYARRLETGEDTLISKRKLSIALSGGIVSEESLDRSLTDY